MSEINKRNGMFNVKPKRKTLEGVEFPPVTKNYPSLIRGEIPRPERMPDSVSLVHLANYVFNYPQIFSPEEIDQFSNPSWVMMLNLRLTAIVTTCYNGSSLTKKDRDLSRHMADELTMDGGGYTFFLKFAGNWFANKLLYCRYKTVRFTRDRAARGVPRSAQKQRTKEHHYNTKRPTLDKNQHSNAGGRAVSKLMNRSGRPKGLASLWLCPGCMEYHDPSEWAKSRYQACRLHEHDDVGGQYLPRHRSAHSTNGSNRTSNTRRTVVPAYDSSEEEHNSIDLDESESVDDPSEVERHISEGSLSQRGVSRTVNGESLESDSTCEFGEEYGQGNEVQIMVQEDTNEDEDFGEEAIELDYEEESEQTSDEESADTSEHQTMQEVRAIAKQRVVLKQKMTALKQATQQRKTHPRRTSSKPPAFVTKLNKSPPKKPMRQLKDPKGQSMSRQSKELPTPPVASRMKRARQAAPQPELGENAALVTRLRRVSSKLPSASKPMDKNSGRRTRGRKPLSDTNSIPLPPGRS